MAKFRRRPNNSGTVVKLSGNRRKPYAAKVTLDERNPVNGEKKRLVSNLLRLCERIER